MAMKLHMQLLPKNENVERIIFLFEMDLRQALKKMENIRLFNT